MKKSDLKNGMILVSKKGSVSIWTEIHGAQLLITIGSDFGGRFNEEHLDDDLNSVDGNDQFSIEKIHQLTVGQLYGSPLKDISNFLNDSNKIWERPKPLKLVEFEQAWGMAPSTVSASYSGFGDIQIFRNEKQYFKIDFHNAPDSFIEMNGIKDSIIGSFQDIFNDKISGSESKMVFVSLIDSPTFLNGANFQFWDENNGLIEFSFYSNISLLNFIETNDEN